MISLSTKSTQDHVWKFKPVKSPSDNQNQDQDSSFGPKSAYEVCAAGADFAAAANRILASGAYRRSS